MNMKLLRIDAENPKKEFISYAADKIIEGKILIYPTDTVYGLGCSIDFKDSIKRIFEIKKRDPGNPLSVAFSGLEMAKGYVLLGQDKEEFIKERIDGPFTFVVRKTRNVQDIITAGRNTVGVRFPNHRVVKELLSCAGVPIITTSANISGGRAPVGVEQIDKEIIERVDLVIDAGPCKIGIPSRVIDVSSDEVLR
jgi:L-threonylcarbamoyladenylate synthase